MLMKFKCRIKYKKGIVCYYFSDVSVTNHLHNSRVKNIGLTGQHQGNVSTFYGGREGSLELWGF